MKKPPRIPWAKPWITEDDRQAVMCVLKSGRLACGPEVDALEEEFARYHKYKHGIAVSSGMAALHMLRENIGTDLAVTGATFPPVYAQIGQRMVDLGDEGAAYGPYLATALYHSDMVEPDGTEPTAADFAEAVGTVPPGGCDVIYSFYPNKQVCGGEGGILLTNNRARADWYRRARNNGRDGGGWMPVQWGTNLRMPEMTAALIRSQFRRINEILRRRRRLFHRYGALMCPSWGGWPPWSCFAFPLVLDTPGEAQSVAYELAKERIEYRFPFPAQPGCPEWTRWTSRVVLLPFYTTMSEAEQDLVIRVVKRVTL